MSDLKPCPFCGDPPYLVHSEERTQSRKRPWQIECCDVTVGPNRSRGECEDWWNTRHVDYFANLGKALWMAGAVSRLLDELYHEAFGDGFCSDNVTEVYTPHKTIGEALRSLSEELWP